MFDINIQLITIKISFYYLLITYVFGMSCNNLAKYFHYRNIESRITGPRSTTCTLIDYFIYTKRTVEKLTLRWIECRCDFL